MVILEFGVWVDYLSSSPAHEPKPRKHATFFFLIIFVTKLCNNLPILIFVGQPNDKAFPSLFSECEKNNSHSNKRKL